MDRHDEFYMAGTGWLQGDEVVITTYEGDTHHGIIQDMYWFADGHRVGQALVIRTNHGEEIDIEDYKIKKIIGYIEYLEEEEI